MENAANEEVRDVVRQSTINPLPIIEQCRKPPRESTMRNVLLAVNRITAAAKLPRDISSGGATTTMYHADNASVLSGETGAERPAIRKNNRFSHAGVGVGALTAARARDSDFDRATLQQRLSHLNDEDRPGGEHEHELLERDTEMTPEPREPTERPSSIGLSPLESPLPILARGKFGDEEPEAV